MSQFYFDQNISVDQLMEKLKNSSANDTYIVRSTKAQGYFELACYALGLEYQKTDEKYVLKTSYEEYMRALEKTLMPLRILLEVYTNQNAPDIRIREKQKVHATQYLVKTGYLNPDYTISEKGLRRIAKLL